MNCKIPEGVRPIPVPDMTRPGWEEQIDAAVREYHRQQEILRKVEARYGSRGGIYCCQFDPVTPGAALARVVGYFDEEEGVYHREEYDADGVLLLEERTDLRPF